ncbi:YpmA family protein [Bacillus sp. 1P06AnD]|uniref:YpmA family protein n=1 Tax=Bacillus sp. 1P06AnD TaxID=3132208 RepID=UPI0039A35FE2
MQDKPEVISTVKVQYQPDLYKIVDTLNRSLKYDQLMFGLALDRENQEQAVITIYRT